MLERSNALRQYPSRRRGRQNRCKKRLKDLPIAPLTGCGLCDPAWPFSDTNDWAAIADPRFAPGIIIAERYGIMPELFISDSEYSSAMLNKDTINLKVRHFLSVFVADYRPLYKANVA